MRLFLIALLIAISYAQTVPSGFCVEWNECDQPKCDTAEAQYCPCTCKPGTVNSGADHWEDTFGPVNTSTAGGETPTDTTTGGDSAGGDVTGNGGGGDANTGNTGTSDQTPQMPNLSWSMVRTGYICEEQDFELLHFHIGMMITTRQCAEQVASHPQCSPVFWTGSMTGACGCVRRGYECAENEGNDMQQGVNIYMLGMGVGMGAGPTIGGPTGGFPGGFQGHAGANQPGFGLGFHDMFMNPEFEAPEPEDFFPGLIGMLQGGMGGGPMGGGGRYNFKLSKAAPQQAQTMESISKGPSTLVMAMCVIIPTFIGFLAGIAMFRWKYQPNAEYLL